MTFDNDYAYLQVFIDIFKQLVEIILMLFKGLTGETASTTAPEE